MAFYSVQEMIDKTKEKKLPLWRVVLQEHVKDQQCTAAEATIQMKALWTAMQAASAAYDKKDRSESGLTGGDGGLVEEQLDRLLCGGFMGKVMAEALKMGECNACMKRIVAAPTAGSCGVLPAVLITVKAELGLTDEDIMEGLFVAAGFGQVIASRAFIAGAEGGCQAEIGSASAMAAAALCAMRGGSPEASAHACSFALENLMGLVCDPVAGLVELPCVRRNVVGALNAVSCADMALCGMTDRIPTDQVIDAMREVGEALPPALRETGKGGIAATPEGVKIAEAVLDI